MNAAIAIPASAVANSVDEAFVSFGPALELMGILTGTGNSGPILLLPSAGLQPRSGPYRLHVLLARHLAPLGFRCFRYDIPGVGEAPRPSACDAVEATIAAMDQLQAQHGADTFIVGGICSAADIGWAVATRDERVRALLLLDAICFRGPWYHYARALSLLRRIPREWRHFSRRLATGLGRPRSPDAGDFRSWPSHVVARAQFEEMLDRDVQMLFVYSGGFADRFMHRRQFRWAFGRSTDDPKVCMHYWPDCDHTYYGDEQRRRLITRIATWLEGMETRGSDENRP